MQDKENNTENGMKDVKQKSRHEQSGPETETIENEKIEDVQEKNSSPDETVRQNEEISRLKDQYVRLLAEFDNFRKRTAKEKSELISTAAEEVMAAMLPVLDDFERTLAAVQKSDNVASIRDGIRLVTENFFKVLNRKGLEPIKTVGEAFDSSLHEAVTSIAVEDEKSKGRVIEEIEKGYKLNGKVIRFPKVIVGE